MRRPTDQDWQRATTVFNRYVSIFESSEKEGLTVCSMPIVISNMQPLAKTVKDDRRIMHNCSKSRKCLNCNDVISKIALKLAKIRCDKDDACCQELITSNIAMLEKPVVVDATIRDQVVDETVSDSEVDAREQHIPSPTFNGSGRWWWGGFFAGLGLSGSIGYAAYFLRTTCQDGIRVACGSASAAASIAFLFAWHKLARESGNAQFWQGMRYGAGAGVLASAGLFAAHGSPAVHKLLALASRKS